MVRCIAPTILVSFEWLRQRVQLHMKFFPHKMCMALLTSVNIFSFILTVLQYLHTILSRCACQLGDTTASFYTALSSMHAPKAKLTNHCVAPPTLDVLIFIFFASLFLLTFCYNLQTQILHSRMQTSAVAALPNSIGCTHLDLAVLVKVSRHYLSQKKNQKKKIPSSFFFFFWWVQ